MKPRFLLDENLPPRLALALSRSEPSIDILRIGDPGAPALGAVDPEVLTFVDRGQRILVTGSRSTMPDHLRTYLAACGHSWGIAFFRRVAGLPEIVETLLLIWAASEAEEWRDRIFSIPF